MLIHVTRQVVFAVMKVLSTTISLCDVQSVCWKHDFGFFLSCVYVEKTK
jgi:hypothetical protein